MKRTALTFGIAVLLLMAAAPRTEAAFSGFDDGSEGWMVADLADYGPYTVPLGLYDPTYNATGGNPGGYLSAKDPTGNTFYWQAPTKFLGDQSAAYGATLSWDQRHDGSISWNNSVDLVLVGGGYTLVKSTGLAPGSDWTRFSVVLNEPGWTLDSPGGAAATATQFKAVLSSLEALRIRGEYTLGDDISGLDSVLVTPVPEPSTWVAGVFMLAMLCRRAMRGTRGH